MACTVDCELVDITTSGDCNLTGGIKVAYWTKDASVDWAATLADITPQFDTSTKIFAGFTMEGSDVWNKITFKRKGSSYASNYTSENRTYDTNITNLFEGKGSTLRNALEGSLRCCNVIYYVLDNNCDERLFGKEYDGDSFQDYIEPLKIRSHDDISGEIGGDNPSDTVVFGGEHQFPALYGNITQSTFESTYL